MAGFVTKLEDMKILIVEDQKEARDLLKNMLTEMGVTQVFECPDGGAALDFIEAAMDFINVVICDWNMPNKTGLEVLKEIRAIDPGMPFLMVTGRGDMDSVMEAKTSGVTAYIRKPFSGKELEAKLRIIMQRRAA